VQGSQFSMKATPIDRGIFMPWCICVAGGGTVFIRVDDGIDISPAGGAAKSITDETLYPLFQHENSSPPVPITRNGVTIYPPNDALPQLQKFSEQNGYMYYDYQGTDGNPHTLVFDIGAMAWIWDVSNPAATIHAANEGESVQGCLIGCADGTIRNFLSTGAETVTGTVVTPAFGGKGFQHTGQVAVEYSSKAVVSLSFIAADEGNGSYAPAAVTLPATGGQITKYFFKPSPNKYKLMQVQIQSVDPSLQVYLQGLICYQKAWGSEQAYAQILPFASDGGEG
jgi:hypothetical protein